jgi:plasmid maintenance system antidote protein VapI
VRNAGLAAKAHVSKSTISKALGGRTLPTPTTVKALATAFEDDPAVWLQRLEQAQEAQEATVTAAPDTGVGNDATKTVGREQASSAESDVPQMILLAGGFSLAVMLVLGLVAWLVGILSSDTGMLEWASGTPVSNQEKPRNFFEEREHEAWVWQNIGPHATISTRFTTGYDGLDIKTLGKRFTLGPDCSATVAWTIKADGATVATGTLDSSAAKPLEVELQGITGTIDITATRQDDSSCTTSLTWADEFQGRK